MKNPILGLNLCPKKLLFELQQIGMYSNVDTWWKSKKFVQQTISDLISFNISIVRLNIFNTELYPNGILDLQPIEVFQTAAKGFNLKIDLCIGPFQYPLYPGIRLPNHLSWQSNSKFIDSNSKIHQFGKELIASVLKKYGKSRSIRAFYLGNNWHTPQAVENSNSNQQLSVTLESMLHLSRLAKKLTKKPIIFNTNYDVSQTKKIHVAFLPILKVLKQQAVIGLDIYPSSLNLTQNPKIFISRKLTNLSAMVSKLKKELNQEIIVSEFEAQPWGDGKSWKMQTDQNSKKLLDDLTNLVANYQKDEIYQNFQLITFWGGEFWIVAKYYQKASEFLPVIAQFLKKA